jgi:hypothetical protein
MAFVPKDWRDSPEVLTPISAAALEDLEARLAAYAESLTTADASTSTKGISKLSVAPVSATNPIACGDNDPRLSPEDDALTISGLWTYTQDPEFPSLRKIVIVSLSTGSQTLDELTDFGKRYENRSTSIRNLTVRTQANLVVPDGGYFEVYTTHDNAEFRILGEGAGMFETKLSTSPIDSFKLNGKYATAQVTHRTGDLWAVSGDVAL